MSHGRLTTTELAGCLRILKEAHEPLVAAKIAGRLNLPGERETQRRHVRAIVKQLRDDGAWIVADLSGGYWLTEDAAIWTEYNEFRTVDAKRILGEAHHRTKIAKEPSGQLVMFAGGR